MVEQPVIDRVLDLAQEGARRLGALLHPDGVHQAPLAGAQRLLAQRPLQQLPVLDQDLQGSTRLVCLGCASIMILQAPQQLPATGRVPSS